MFILLLIITPLAFYLRHWWVRPLLPVNTLSANYQIVGIFSCFEYHYVVFARRFHIISFISLHMDTDRKLLLKHTCWNTPLSSFKCIFSCLAYISITTVTHSCIYSSCTLSYTHTHTHTHTQTHPLNFIQRGSCVEYRANAPDLKVSLLPQMWHQLVLSLASPLLPLLPSSFLSSFISWAHLLTLQKVFLTCLSPLPSSTNSFFPALYREHASLSETYVLCRVNALAFASPWSW